VKICIIGKYPPIQGGVSMRTYWHAHGLATLGHEVHVVTNAKEAVSPFRMYMRAEDWARCEASRCGGGRGRQYSINRVDRPAVSIAVEAGSFAERRSGEPLSLDERGASYCRV
jgi:hypothetical protein